MTKTQMMEVRSQLSIWDQVAFLTKDSILTSKVDFIEHLKLFLEFLTHKLLICGPLDAFWLSCLLGFQYFQVKVKRNNLLIKCNIEEYLQLMFKSRQQEGNCSLMKILNLLKWRIHKGKSLFQTQNRSNNSLNVKTNSLWNSSMLVFTGIQSLD